ncbi:MAG: PQQ-dependent sugar dehydrogenase, partial [Chloroflexota bacterium]
MRLLRHCLPLLLVSALAAACGTPPSSDPRPAPSSGAPSSSAPTPAPTPSPAGSSAASASASPTAEGISDDPPRLALETVADGLAAPIGIASAPGGWLLVNERAGQVVAIHPERDERAISLDIRDRVLGDGERGLLGLALHPDWPADGRAFVHYSDRNGDTVLAEFGGRQDGDGAPLIDPGSEGILLTLDQPFA